MPNVITNLSRRRFVAAIAASAAFRASAEARRMKLSLSCGAVGVKANQLEAINFAQRHGFEAVEAQAGYIGSLADSELAKLADTLKEKGLSWGPAGLGIDFRAEEGQYNAALQQLPGLAGKLQRVGVTRMTRWLSPTHDSLTYLQNFKLHARRIGQVAAVLDDHGVRLGLEYVGPKTSWTVGRYPFVHTMAEAKELIGETGKRNVGLLLDTFHWYTSHETVADLLSLKADQVVSVDLNDAPAGRKVDEQIDGQRDLPAATGVIDVKGFLGALNQIGFDGPVRAEPFKKEMRQMPPDEALDATIGALKKAFALVG
ncbi:MAG: sugar phosphate isomerase/epimerase [Acidobacteria bacterium]|nr:sugar phosphate isomerase/epimerase [Acidobacteriota bacterium]